MVERSGRLNESFYRAIQFLKSADSVKEIKTVVAGEIRIVKEDGASTLSFRSDLIRASLIVDGKTVFPTLVEEDPEIRDRIGFFSDFETDENNKLYTFDESGIYARMRAV